MKKLFSTLLAFVLVLSSCTVLRIEDPLPTDNKEYAFGYPKDFLLITEHTDIHITSTHYVIQSGQEYLTYSVDNEGRTLLCSTLVEADSLCVGNDQTPLESADAEGQYGIHKKTIERILGRHVQLPEGKLEATHGSYSINFNDTKELLPVFGQYLSQKETLTTNTCLSLKGEEEDKVESETFCYAGDYMPLYAYSYISIVPVTITRSLKNIEYRSFTTEELSAIYQELLLKL